MQAVPTSLEKTAKHDLLPSNAAALAAHHPGAWRQILAGLPASPCPSAVDDPHAPFSLRLGRTLLHSTADPLVEAQSLVASCGVERASSVIVFGFGAGYLVDAARRGAEADARIYVVVLDPRAFVLTLSCRDVSEILTDRRIRILIGDLATVASAMPGVDETLVVLTHEPILAAAAPELLPLVNMARELAATQRSRRLQLGGVLENIEHNLDRILAAGSVPDLAPTMVERPAILVAPGPSLDTQLPLLASRPLPLLVALDTSLRSLKSAGVAPDLCVTLDSTPGNVAKFEGLDVPCPLVFFGGARPEALALAQEAVFACEEDGLLDRAHPWFARGGRFRSGGSVLLAALEVLLAAGADPIVLVGADLALTGGRGHASAVQRRRASVGGRQVPRRGGGSIATTESLWRHWRRLQRRLAALPRGRVLDARTDGAELGAATGIDLGTWLSGLGPEELAASRPRLGMASPAQDDVAVIRAAALEAIERARQ